MKKLIFIGLLAVCAYKFYQFSYSKILLSKRPDTVQVFVGPGCEKLCADVEEELGSRKVKYEAIDISTPEGEKYGINTYPQTRIGRQTVMGDDRNHIISALAETYGSAVLTPIEQSAMKNHFDQNGKPVVVLYGTSWCGFCKNQRQYFADHGVSFVDLDVETTPSAKFAYDVLQGNGYPLVYVGYRRFNGYKQQEILDAIAELRS